MTVVIGIAILAFLSIIAVNYKKLFQDARNADIDKARRERQEMRTALEIVKNKQKEKEQSYEEAKKSYHAAKRAFNADNSGKPNS